MENAAANPKLPLSTEAFEFALKSRPFGLKPLTRPLFEKLGQYVYMREFFANQPDETGDPDL